MRFDRQLTTSLFHPLWRAGLMAEQWWLPILMYHSVSDEPEPGVSSYYKTTTSPAVFRAHLRLLREEGYAVLSLTAALDIISGATRPSSQKQAVITFDDGFQNFHTDAFPALRDYGFTATVFLPTDFIGDSRQSFKGAPCLTWEEVRHLRHEGIHFGSHTVHHPKLYDLPWNQIECELRDSRHRLEQELSEPSATFAYPYAFPQGDPAFAEKFEGLVRAAGYTCCLTTEIGRATRADNPFRLKRLPANSLDDAKMFQAKLEGGYDWLGWPQGAFKRLRANARAKSLDNAFDNKFAGSIACTGVPP
jgi:peptidoglycan/xylan/chitin deacetylase (PgdA/CDA1 family)